MNRQEEIVGILGLLQELWTTYPEQRLGQLIYNLRNGGDLFYMRDTEILLQIRNKIIGKDHEEG